MERTYQVGNGRSHLGTDQLERISSLWAMTPSENVSGKYRQVRTMDVVKIFMDENWLPVMAQEQLVRVPGREGFQRHMIRFRQQFPQAIGDVFPEIVMRNAHDGTTAYQLMAGLFRLACLNGLVVSEASFGAIRIKHVGFDPQEVIEATRHFSGELPKVTGRIKEYQKIPLSIEERKVFAESALLVKFAGMKEGEDEKAVDNYGGVFRSDGNIIQIGTRQFNVKGLLTPRRSEDEAPTLWNTFNIVQEKMTQGNRFEVNPGKYARHSTKKVRAIKSIDEGIRVNRGLWHLMSEMAKLKGVI